MHAYIDETGDRSNGNRTGNSLIFGMAAIIVTPEGDREVQEAINHLREKFRIPADIPLSSKKHLRKEEKRRYAADTLSKITGLRVIYTYAVKSEITGNFREDKTLFYNWVAMQTYKRVLWAARNWKGSGEKIQTHFGHVKDHDHQTTRDYFETQLPLESKVPSHMSNGVDWVSATTYTASQAADIYASFIGKILDPKNKEPYHLELFQKIWPQIRKDDSGCPINLGVMSLPRNELFAKSAMNFCQHCALKR